MFLIGMLYMNFSTMVKTQKIDNVEEEDNMIFKKHQDRRLTKENSDLDNKYSDSADLIKKEQTDQ